MYVKDRIKKFIRVPASELIPNPRNWRTHPEGQRKALSGVLDEIGIADAVIARETPEGLQLIDGHLRRDVMHDQNVPVLVLDVTAEEADKLLLTIDPLAAMATQDSENLFNLLDDVRFSDADVNAMLEALANDDRQLLPDLHEPLQDPEPQIDRAEELQEKWGTERGQIWQIGPHRLICGDCTDKKTHELLIENDFVNLVLTDPPYGVGVDYGGFEDTPDNVVDLIQKIFPLISKWPVVMVTPGQRLLWEYPKPTWILQWVNAAGVGLGPWGFICVSHVLVYGQCPYLQNKMGSRPDTLISEATRNVELLHPVIKPLEVWKWFLMRGSIKENDLILDPFIGSGTTMVAAEQLGRVCYGMEIEPKYVAVTLERMADMGLLPELTN